MYQQESDEWVQSWSPKFFPKGIRDDVFKLHSFVIFVDELVKKVPSEKDRFTRLVQRWGTLKNQLIKGTLPNKLDGSVDEQVLYNIAYVVHRYSCNTDWVDAFFASKQVDVDCRLYKTVEETHEYMYGSAEVLSLIMVKILNLPGQGTLGNSFAGVEPEVMRLARKQAKAIQYIIFIKDIAINNKSNRQYFSQEILHRHGLEDLNKKTALSHQYEFNEFINEQLDTYSGLQSEADKGQSYLSERLQVAVKHGVDSYALIAHQIRQNPTIVYNTQIKPNWTRFTTSTVKRLG